MGKKKMLENAVIPINSKIHFPLLLTLQEIINL